LAGQAPSPDATWPPSDFPLSLALEENLGKGAKLVVIDPKRIPLAEPSEIDLSIHECEKVSPELASYCRPDGYLVTHQPLESPIYFPIPLNC
jgi:hypothetical protein